MTNKGSFQKGHIPWHKGKSGVYNADALKKMSDKKMGNTLNLKSGITVDKRGYKLVYSPNHPYRAMRSYVREHRLVVEKQIGRYLLETEVVHHIDGDKSNNNSENLMLFKSHSEHMKYEKSCK